jgi:hypothetical protein
MVYCTCTFLEFYSVFSSLHAYFLPTHRNKEAPVLITNIFFFLFFFFDKDERLPSLEFSKKSRFKYKFLLSFYSNFLHQKWIRQMQ